jgi:hypothetical protein
MACSRVDGFAMSLSISEAVRIVIDMAVEAPQTVTMLS